MHVCSRLLQFDFDSCLKHNLRVVADGHLFVSLVYFRTVIQNLNVKRNGEKKNIVKSQWSN